MLIRFSNEESPLNADGLRIEKVHQTHKDLTNEDDSFASTVLPKY